MLPIHSHSVPKYQHYVIYFSTFCSIPEANALLDHSIDHKDLEFDADDESTIDEQETFEASETLNETLDGFNSNSELTLLDLDNSKSLEELLASIYPGYDLTNDIDQGQQQQHDSSISSEDEEEDLEDISDDDDDDDLDEDDSDLEELIG